MKSFETYNFVNNNTIPATVKYYDDLLLTLKLDAEQEVQWFTQNEMIVNTHIFRAMILNQINLKLKRQKLKQKVKKLEITNDK